MGKGGLGDMMRQVQQMQAKMAEMQEQLESATVEGSAGVNKDDVEMLQDLVKAAVNQARERTQAIQAEQMSGLTGGLNIPGLNLPF
jgi:DNA-binding protein YbaB